MGELDRIDWNLLPALEALLRERNVSRAARRLGISQPAASGALSRLRRHFDDELLVRRGNGYDLTPVAQRLLPMVSGAVETTRAALTSTASFDPAGSTREFTVLSTEYGQTVLGPLLLGRVAELAPSVRVTFRWPAGTSLDATDWLARADGWIGPRDVLPDMPSTGLLEDRWVCVVDGDNDAVGDTLSIDEVAAHRWILPTRPREHDLPWRQRLLAHDVDLPIAASTESFAAVPFLLRGTQHVGILQHALARTLQPSTGLRVLELPWSMLPLNFTLWWHPNRDHDHAHTWFRELLAECMAGV